MCPCCTFKFLVVAAVFGAIAWVAAGRGGGLDDPRQDRPEPALADDRQLGREDIDSARFAVGWRGYRMDQVDRLLDRLAAEIDHRDRLIADLTRPAGARFGEAGVGYEPVARTQDGTPGVEGLGGGADAGGAAAATAVVARLRSGCGRRRGCGARQSRARDPGRSEPCGQSAVGLVPASGG